MNDMLKRLEEALEDEAADVEKYTDMAATAAKEWPDAGYCAILRDIAKEEKVHHRHIQEIIDDMHQHAKENA